MSERLSLVRLRWLNEEYTVVDVHPSLTDRIDLQVGDRLLSTSAPLGSTCHEMAKKLSWDTSLKWVKISRNAETIEITVDVEKIPQLDWMNH